MSDVYYSPEDFGLEIVTEVEWSGGSYEFDKTVIWKDNAGQLYLAEDSGCSCPSPFEDYTDIEDLTKVTVHEAIKTLQDTFEETWNPSNSIISDYMDAITVLMWLK